MFMEGLVIDFSPLFYRSINLLEPSDILLNHVKLNLARVLW